jgi:hypothetical protein
VNFPRPVKFISLTTIRLCIHTKRDTNHFYYGDYMKILFSVVLTILIAAPSFAATDCTDSSLRYRKAVDSYNNIITQQWACAAALSIPFKDRDTNPQVGECRLNSVLYKSAITKNSSCLELRMKDGSKHVLLEVLSNEGNFIPVYQTTTY